MTCIIKYDRWNGKELPEPEQVMWCGKKRDTFKVCFTSLQHFALSQESKDIWGWPACKECTDAALKILKETSYELQNETN